MELDNFKKASWKREVLVTYTCSICRHRYSDFEELKADQDIEREFQSLFSGAEKGDTFKVVNDLGDILKVFSFSHSTLSDYGCGRRLRVFSGGDFGDVYYAKCFEGKDNLHIEKATNEEFMFYISKERDGSFGGVHQAADTFIDSLIKL